MQLFGGGHTFNYANRQAGINRLAVLRQMSLPYGSREWYELEQLNAEIAEDELLMLAAQSQPGYGLPGGEMVLLDEEQMVLGEEEMVLDEEEMVLGEEEYIEEEEEFFGNQY